MSAEALKERVGQQSLVDLLARVLAKVDHWPHSSTRTRIVAKESEHHRKLAKHSSTQHRFAGADRRCRRGLRFQWVCRISVQTAHSCPGSTR